MKKNTLILLMFTCISLNVLCAQENNAVFSTPDLSPLAPEAYSLFKHTEIPVSNYTGVPSISIPIYEINLGDFSYPIAFSYHSSGVRSDEIASNVGLGWSLIAGGVITSQVNGLPDFAEYGEVVPYITSTNLIPQSRELDPVQTWPDCSFITDTDYQLAKDLILNKNDTEPDIFHFSTGNINGKFFYSKDGVANTIPYQPLKIERFTTSYLITDEKGVIYTFEKIGNKTTLSSTFSSFANINSNNSTIEYLYYLTQIETPNKKVITFEYTDDFYYYEDAPVYSRYKRPFQNIVNGDNPEGFNYPIFVESKTEKKTYYRGKKIKRILWNSNEELTFIYNTCPRLDLPINVEFSSPQPPLPGGFALKEIQLKKGAVVIESHILEHDYFNLLTNFEPCITQSNSEQINSYRLKLKSITKSDNSSHDFEYYEGFMPSRLSDNQDHWGYFNPQGSRYAFDDFFQDGTSRSADFNFTRLGTLKKIIYPTKGCSVFDYELNQIYGRNNSIVQNSVSLHLEGDDELSNNPSNEPQYLSLNFNIPSNLKLGTVRIYITATEEPEQTTTNWSNVTLKDSNNNIIPLPPVNSLANLNIGIGNYTLFVSGVLDYAGAEITWLEETEGAFENKNVGGLRIKQISNFLDSEASISTSKKTYTYGKVSDPNISSGVMISSPRYTYVKQFLEPVCHQNVYWNNLGYYVQNSKTILPLNSMQGYHIMYENVRIADDEINSNGFIDYKYSVQEPDDEQYTLNPLSPITSHDFKRGDLLEESIFKKTDNGFVLTNKVVYEYQYNFTETNDATPQLFVNPTLPNEKHALGISISMKNQEFCCFGHQTWDKVVSQFDFSYYKLYSVWKYLKKKTDYAYYSDGSILTNVTNYAYNNSLHGQLSSVSSFNSTNEENKTEYLYPHDYEVSSKPFVQDLISKNIINVPLVIKTFNENGKLFERETVYYDWGDGLLAPQVIKGGKENSSLEDRIVYHKYDTYGHPLEVSRSDGVHIVYIWGYNQSQPIAMIENLIYASIPTQTIANLQSLSDSDNDRTLGASGNEGALRTALNALRASYPEAMVSTYTYDPLIGVTSMTDAKGYTMYYEYDEFNRLKHVKDKDGNILSENQYNYKQ